MKRNKHNLSHYHLTTGNMGELIPVGLTEVLPGDSFQHGTSALIRLSPLAAPVMHPATVRIHHFFVPHRLIWEDAGGAGSFEDFMTGGGDGYDSQVVPTMATTGATKDLFDHYGLPRVSGIQVSALPVTGFNAIFNEYYRDQDLVAARDAADLTVPRCAWEKDYFTSSRPWPQKGPDVVLPIGGSAPVRGIGGLAANTYAPSASPTRETGGIETPAGQKTIAGSGSSSLWWEQDPENTGYPAIFADLSEAEAVKVNEFRRAFALQRYQEARARYGSRYTEYLRYLGIRPSDARLDRPEYLGGGKVRISISEVLQTGPDAAGADPAFGVGDMYGHGIAALRSNRYRRFFEEHGYVHTLLSVRPKAIYSNGINKTWLRQVKEDFHQRELEHIGQQAVQLNEIYADAANGTQTFGYQDRYREYREHPSFIASEFRDVLNYWHMARGFESAPALNASFVECDATKRIFNEQTMDSLWMMIQHRLVARRMVSRNAGGRIL